MTFSWNSAPKRGQNLENGQFWTVKKWSIKSGVLHILLFWLSHCIQKKPGEPSPGPETRCTDVVYAPGSVVHGGGTRCTWCGTTPWYGSGSPSTPPHETRKPVVWVRVTSPLKTKAKWPKCRISRKFTKMSKIHENLTFLTFQTPLVYDTSDTSGLWHFWHFCFS